MYNPIWFNKPSNSEPLFIKEWFSKGIIILGDILTKDNTLESPEQLQHKFQVKKPDFLTLHRINKSVTNQITNNNIFSRVERPYIPNNLKIVLKDKKGIKTIYNKFFSDKNLPFKNEKWNDNLSLNIDQKTWSKTFNICFNTITDNYIIWLQYRIIHRTLGCKYLLKK